MRETGKKQERGEAETADVRNAERASVGSQGPKGQPGNGKKQQRSEQVWAVPDLTAGKEWASCYKKN